MKAGPKGPGTRPIHVLSWVFNLPLKKQQKGKCWSPWREVFPEGSSAPAAPRASAVLLPQSPPARAPMWWGLSSVPGDGWVEGMGGLQGHIRPTL